MDTLYKYVTADLAMICLPEIGDGSLRASQPSALNDPFECALSFIIVTATERSWMLTKSMKRNLIVLTPAASLI